MSNFSFKLTTFTMSMLLTPYIHAEKSAQLVYLLEQVKNGEVVSRDDIIEDVLFKLELIDPKNPDYISAKIRYYFRQGDNEKANELLLKLKEIAPTSTAYQQATVSQRLSTLDGVNLLNSARLQEKNGNHEEAIKLYDKFFDGIHPTVELQIEYLNTYLNIPIKEKEALEKFKILYRKYPHDPRVIGSLAEKHFSSGKNKEGFDLLAKLSTKDKESEVIGANIWLKKVQGWPTNTKSIAALEQMITLFPSASEQQEEAREVLIKQKNDMKNPAFYTKAEGMLILDSKDYNKALPYLLRALKKNPKDADLLGEIGLIYSKKGNRKTSIDYLSRALHIAPKHNDNQYWRNSLKMNKYWMMLSIANDFYDNNELDKSQEYYKTALSIDPKEPQAWVGIGNIYANKKEYNEAESHYLSAIKLDKNNLNAIQGLTEVYLQQSPNKSYVFLDNLSDSQKKLVNEKGYYLYSKVLGELAIQAEENKDIDQSINIRKKISQLNKHDSWNSYHLAKNYFSIGKFSEANNIIETLDLKNKNNPDLTYVKSLYYLSIEQPKTALSTIEKLPKYKWNQEVDELYQRIKFDEKLVYIKTLKISENEEKAIQYLYDLNKTLDNPYHKKRSMELLSDWSLEKKQYQPALNGYQDILKSDPDDESALIGEIEALMGLKNKSQAHEKIKKLSGINKLSINNQRKIANILFEIGATEQAENIFHTLLNKNKEITNEDFSLILRDSSRILSKNHNKELALDRYTQALISSGITEKSPKNRERLTSLTKYDENDNWIRRSIRSDLAELTKRNDIFLTLEYDYLKSGGKSGYSKLGMQTTMLQSNIPLHTGVLFLRAENVNLNAGKLKIGENNKFGSCYNYDPVCTLGKKQRYIGNSFAVGWENKNLSWDLGITPSGFEINDWVGGINYHSNFGDVGWTLNVHRRPVSSSLLAFGGQTDPKTNITWGGVRRTGMSLSGSYDTGGQDGYWADISADALTGKNVADNHSIKWMGGYYYKVINAHDRRLSVGLSNMLWHYEKDLSGYTLGQGGYYSPQQYVSFSFPFSYRQRTQDWSWEVSGSVSWSYSHTEDQKRYPIPQLIESTHLTAKDKAILRQSDNNRGSYSQGVGYTTRFLLEHKIAPQWFVGAAVDIQQAKDHKPSHALLYLRYSFHGWSGDLDMPPQLLIPYADFK